MKKGRWFLLVLGVVVVGGVVFLTYVNQLVTGQRSENTQEILAKEAEKFNAELPTNVRLPAFALGRSELIRETYSLAYLHRDVLAYMPCYCGCQDEGHQHNMHCFIKNVKSNHEIAWDPMGAT